MKSRVVLDVSHLPSHSFGPASPMWWGTLGFVATEGAVFAAAIGAYFYLMFANADWPLGVGPPQLGPGTAILALLLLSAVPNLLLDKRAKHHDLRACRILLLVLSALGLAILAIRVLEFEAVGLKWNANAYGSIVWAILVLHTAHLATDLADTLVLTVLMFTRHGHGKRFSMVSDNAFYWNFVVLSWAALYAVLYWAPRL